jgi:hypothetical protein
LQSKIWQTLGVALKTPPCAITQRILYNVAMPLSIHGTLFPTRDLNWLEEWLSVSNRRFGLVGIIDVTLERRVLRKSSEQQLLN